MHFYILIELVMIICFFYAYHFNKVMFWFISGVFSSSLMIASFNIHHYFIAPTSYPYMSAFNLMFFALSLFYFVVDLYDQYGIYLEKNGDN